jgi:hypothetical protein
LSRNHWAGVLWQAEIRNRHRGQEFSLHASPPAEIILEGRTSLCTHPLEQKSLGGSSLASRNHRRGREFSLHTLVESIFIFTSACTQQQNFLLFKSGRMSVFGPVVSVSLFNSRSSVLFGKCLYGPASCVSLFNLLQSSSSVFGKCLLGCTSLFQYSCTLPTWDLDST